MGSDRFQWPRFSGVRGPGFWLSPANWIAARKKMRRDFTVEWRRRYELEYPSPPARTTDFRQLIGRDTLGESFSFIILGDTGEGDRSQYGLLPLIRTLGPDFLIINGDLAYPAGREDDFVEGFFLPYQNLQIPIWAVPGNHEYYSPHNGREFFDLFCTPKHAKLWQNFGLRFVRQPGTYWEIASPDCPLVVLGVDSGMTATMDADHAWGHRSDGDGAQIAWLEWRLSVAGATGKKAVVLFHIPALVNLQRAGEPKLMQLHGVLARCSSAIAAVITAHEHSFQHYSPETFAAFVSGGMRPGPHYFVSGAGGAFLTPVTFDFQPPARGFRAERLFPDRKQWDEYARHLRKAIGRARIRSVLARVLNSIEGALWDQDLARFLSLIQVKAQQVNGSWKVDLVPYLQPSLDELYSDQPAATVVVRDGQPPPTPASVAKCAAPAVPLLP